MNGELLDPCIYASRSDFDRPDGRHESRPGLRAAAALGRPGGDRAGAVPGWHHHERNESSLYIVRGVLRLECEGHDGYLDAGPGDFVHVPAWTVHRESNPTREPSLAVIARVGGGILTVNVDAPANR